MLVEQLQNARKKQFTKQDVFANASQSEQTPDPLLEFKSKDGQVVKS